MKNLKRIILALMALTVCFAADAGIRFGVKAGLNVNNLHFNQSLFDAKNRAGFTGGVMTEIMIPVVGIGFDASLMYTRMNSRDYVNTSYDNVEEVQFGKDFIEIPVNVKYKLSLPAIESLIKPYVYTGPTFAFKLNKNTIEYMKARTCQVAWNIGLGIELIKHLQVQASYGFGINNVAQYTELVSTEKLKVKNNYWTVTAAWLF